jgi:uncharacterized protein (TIGR00303 family)
MAFLSDVPEISFKKPIFGLVLGNTLLSTVPGVSGAGPSPENTLFTPILDAELVLTGAITSLPLSPNTPTGCPTPASISRSIVQLTGISPVFINAGLKHSPTVPCIDVYGEAGGDPRIGDAVPRARQLFDRGRYLGSLLSRYSDLLVLGECVPGGTTTALCVLRGLGYAARVSSSFVDNPHSLKDDICSVVQERIYKDGVTKPLDVVRYAGDPMIAVAAGIAKEYTGSLILAGGTQMLAVAAVLSRMGEKMPLIVTTTYVRDDTSASFTSTLGEVGADACYVDPDFGDLGHAGLARYCIGEVKEGMGAGGAMFLAYLMGYSPDTITRAILEFVGQYS